MLELFSQYSGLKINTHKSLLVPLGSGTKETPSPSCPYKWLDQNSHERFLGVNITLDQKEDSNWEPLITKLFKSIEIWKNKNLTLFGRITAARTYIASKAWFVCNFKPPPPRMLNRIQAGLWCFIQTNNLLPIDSNRHYSPWASTTLSSPLTQGGLTAIDFSLQTKAIHAKWIFSTLSHPTEGWTILPLEFLTATPPKSHIFISHPMAATLITSPRWHVPISLKLAANHISGSPSA